MEIMPNSKTLEMGILGSMLSNEKAHEMGVDTLTSNDFYDVSNRTIFDAIKSLEKCDPIIVSSVLSEKGELDRIGGIMYLMELADYISPVSLFETEIKKLKDLSNKRELINKIDKAKRECTTDRTCEEILEDLSNDVYDISMQNADTEFLGIKDVLSEITTEIADAKDKGGIVGIPTGYTDLDNITCGLSSGDYVLIGARPSMGKTTLAINIAQNVAFRQHKNVAIFSLEMPTKQLVYRILSSETGVNLKRLKTGVLYPNEWNNLKNYIDKEQSKQEQYMYIEDNGMLTVADIRKRCRKLKADKGLDLIVIDYLQLIVGSGKENRVQEVSEISRQLKALAKEIECPIIILSQLSRALESRQDKRPILSDLRESGAIEQDADIVIMLYRDDYYNNAESEDGYAEINIVKHRNGELGTFFLDFDKECCKFSTQK